MSYRIRVLTDEEKSRIFSERATYAVMMHSLREKVLLLSEKLSQARHTVAFKQEIANKMYLEVVRTASAHEACTHVVLFRRMALQRLAADVLASQASGDGQELVLLDEYARVLGAIETGRDAADRAGQASAKAGMALRDAKAELSNAQVEVSDLKVQFSYLFALVEEFFGIYEGVIEKTKGV